MAHLIWTPRALEDLERLVRHIEKDAPLAARRFAQKILARVETLPANPLWGGLIPEDEHGIYRQVLQGNYRVIYRFDGQAVYIVAIHHAARLLDPDSLT